VTLALLLLAQAHAHGGHTSTLPWDACAGAQLSAACSWEAADLLHRGTCRGAEEALLCVRNQPLVPAHAHPLPAAGILGIAACLTGALAALGMVVRR